ncbi:MAG: hypothetical protein ABI972_19710 [Acidobacteriota bacterium]
MLEQLYRRRVVVRRLIRTLELYSNINRQHKAHVPVISVSSTSRHAN